MKIAILADSLALPRGKDWGDTAYEETYPFLLEQALNKKLSDIHLIERGMRFRTTKEVIDDWEEIVTLRKVDAVIVHVGLVDCAPRVFMPHERQLLQKMPPVIRNIIIKIAHKYRAFFVRSRRGQTYLTPDQFKKNLRKIISLATRDKIKQLIFIDIIAPTHDHEVRTPGFQNNVRIYNKILKTSSHGKVSKLINLNDIIWSKNKPENHLVDGMHLNDRGHKLLAQKLVATLGKL